MNPHAVPKEVVEASRELVEKAMASVFRRLTVAIQNDRGEIQMVRYFPYLIALLENLDSTARFYASGGVVRSVMGYLYAQILEGLERDPSLTAEKILMRIIDDPKDLPSIEVRGVGSDFDALLKGEANKIRDLIQKALNVTNSAEAKHGEWMQSGAAKRSLFTIGDVKSYDDQIVRSVRQGGADIDFLAFDVEAGKMIEPPNRPGIFSNFIRGFYRYLKPESPAYVEDGPKQTIRGVRGLLELPFLRIEDETVLKEELQELLQDIEKGRKPGAKALEQFDKMVRNARFSGANNRFYRSAPDRVEHLTLKIAHKLKRQSNQNLIPEFVDRLPLKQKSELPVEFPVQGLLSYEEFVKKIAPGGTIYHGTPSVESGLAIMRKGLFLSHDKQGVAVYGRGAYSSANRSVAEGYAGREGIVFELRVRKDPRLRILDWVKVGGLPWIRNLGQTENEIFEVLSRRYGVDLILHQHILIQNSEAVEMPKSVLKDIALTSLTKAQDTEAPVSVRLVQIQRFFELSDYLMSLGIDIRTEMQRTGAVVRSLFENFPSAVARELDVTLDLYLQLIKILKARGMDHEFDFEGQMRPTLLQMIENLEKPTVENLKKAFAQNGLYRKIHASLDRKKKPEFLSPDQFSSQMIQNLRTVLQTLTETSSIEDLLVELHQFQSLSEDFLVQILNRWSDHPDFPNLMARLLRQYGPLSKLAILQKTALAQFLEDIEKNQFERVRSYARLLSSGAWQLDFKQVDFSGSDGRKLWSILSAFANVASRRQIQSELGRYQQPMHWETYHKAEVLFSGALNMGSVDAWRALTRHLEYNSDTLNSDDYRNFLFLNLKDASESAKSAVAMVTAFSKAIYNPEHRALILAGLKAEAALGSTAQWTLDVLEKIETGASLEDFFVALMLDKRSYSDTEMRRQAFRRYIEKNGMDPHRLIQILKSSVPSGTYTKEPRYQYDFILKALFVTSEPFSKEEHQLIKAMGKAFGDGYLDRLGLFDYILNRDTLKHDPKWTLESIERIQTKSFLIFDGLGYLIGRLMRGDLTPTQMQVIRHFENGLIGWALERINTLRENSNRHGDPYQIAQRAFFVLHFLAKPQQLRGYLDRNFFTGFNVLPLLLTVSDHPFIQKEFARIGDQKHTTDSEWHAFMTVLRDWKPGSPLPKSSTGAPSAKYSMLNSFFYMMEPTEYKRLEAIVKAYQKSRKSEAKSRAALSGKVLRCERVHF